MSADPAVAPAGGEAGAGMAFPGVPMMDNPHYGAGRRRVMVMSPAYEDEQGGAWDGMLDLYDDDAADGDGAACGTVVDSGAYRRARRGAGRPPGGPPEGGSSSVFAGGSSGDEAGAVSDGESVGMGASGTVVDSRGYGMPGRVGGMSGPGYVGPGYGGASGAESEMPNQYGMPGHHFEMVENAGYRGPVAPQHPEW
jgi:hypothetical protein